MALTVAYAWWFDGDSTGMIRVEADYEVRRLRSELFIRANLDGDLSGIQSGPIDASGLAPESEGAYDRWGSEDYYIEIRGSAPDYEDTVIYAHGRYWPWDDFSPWVKDYGIRCTDVRAFEGDEYFERWSE